MSNDRCEAEQQIEKKLMQVLRTFGWFVKKMHGNVYMTGMPDLYAARQDKGARWIEVKKPINYSFTPAQQVTFPELMGHGIGIWVLQGYSENDLKKLDEPANLWKYISLHNKL